MASFKEAQSARPNSQHRLSASSSSTSNMPIRHSSSRHHSHSVSLGTMNSSHRITRRKSMNSTNTNNSTAIAAALQEIGENRHTVSNRRSLNLRNSPGSRGTESMRDASSNADRYTFRGAFEKDDTAPSEAHVMGDSAVADEFLPVEHVSGRSKGRARRASEGSHLTKGEGKRSSGELRCEKCGKGYKHSSCLTKHLWEHTPEWSYTSKLLISKHQQVQLLEAASVLVGMNQDAPTASDIAKTLDSDNSSVSPAASGTSEFRDYDDGDYSSAETTPPPMSEHYAVPDTIESGRSKRYSGNSSSFSRSYQSAPSFSLPVGTAFGNYQQQRRPSNSGLGSTAADEEEAGLVAAVESLCSFGTPRTGPVLLPADVPPVPPLPARFAELNKNRLSGVVGQIPELDLPASTYQRLSDERDVKMGNSHVAEIRDGHCYDERSGAYGKVDEDDDGVFGAMEGVAY